MPNTPIAHIDLAAIRANFDLARSLAPRAKVMSVIKANAYGHGASQVARALDAADAFCVARVDEGVQLRADGIDKPILVLEGFIDADELEASRIERLTPVLHAAYQTELLKHSQHSDLPVWLKVDSGMHRLGFSPEEFRVGMTTGTSLNVIGVMSHLANADDPSHQENRDQIEIFTELTHDLDVELSMANSGGVMNYPTSHLDWIRPGVMLYGGAPDSTPDDRLKAGMTLTAPVVAVRDVAKGESIGYGSSWVAGNDTRVAVVGIGYADGYPREMPSGTPMLVNGKRRGLVARISMDLTFVELEPSDQILPGERVTVWGEGLPVDEIAGCFGTIGYTLMSGLTNRVRREYGD